MVAPYTVLVWTGSTIVLVIVDVVKLVEVMLVVTVVVEV
jgi:hypothetical protein